MCGGVRAWRDPTAEQPPIDLDHLGIATADVAPGLRTLVGRLGATALYGGFAPGCRYVVSRVGDAAEGLDLELLEAHPVGDQFVPSFLDRRGAGPHHLSFLVRDVRAVLARLEEGGIAPAVQRTEDPRWREAFLRSSDAGGIVVQLGETNGGLRSDDAFARARADEPLGAAAQPRRGWMGEAEAWWVWPGARGERTAVLLRVVFTARDLGRVRAFYGDLLDGEVVHDADGELELRWPRGGTLRFVHAPHERDGVAHLALARLPEGVDELEGARLRAAEGGPA